MLQITNLTKSFGGIKAVDHCTFGVEKNSITALIGPNGAGKTTVFQLLSGLEKPDSGSIALEQEDVTALAAFARAQHGFARTFQLNQVFLNLTVEENCLLALDDRDQYFWQNIFGLERDPALRGDIRKKKVREVLKFFGLEDTASQQASLCSYGQQKLVGIARSLLLPHKLLLLDEPVAGVNPKLRTVLSQKLRELQGQGETILLIEHDMDFVMGIADRVIVMSEGRVLKEGTPKEIQNDQQVLEVYLGKN